jgi:hypothetical protein
MIRYPPLCGIDVGERRALMTIELAEPSFKKPQAGLVSVQLR